MKEKKIIPIFFATDNNYVKYLAVALKSLIENANKKDYFYKMYILETDLDEKYLNDFKEICGEYASVEYVSCVEQIKSFASRLTLRDYYTYTTYYRLFITEMFPEIDKALYLDADIIINGDISKLYNQNLSNNLVGAVSEEVMLMNKDFYEYSPLNLNVPTRNYFNAGILVMNLKEFRKFDIYNKFIDLLSVKNYPVAQDQDYLNVLCKDRVKYLSPSWNKTPINVGVICSPKPNIVHYKLTFKPWKYDNIMYGEYFWKYAKETKFYEEILNAKNNYTLEDMERDKMHSEHLHELIKSENAKVLSVINGEDYGRVFERALGV